ncbi:TPA: hypothetical protein ACH3X1_001206 [Trebouxia sp. C0004]
MRLSIRHPEHTDAHGNAIHGCGVDAKGVKHLHGPPLSQTVKDWHSESVFMYQEERSQPAAANSEPGVAQADDSVKPAGNGQLQHHQKFVMGWMTPFIVAS